MKKTAEKIKNRRRTKRRVLILTATLLSLITAAVLLVALQSDSKQTGKKTPSGANGAATVMPDKTPIVAVESPEGTVQMLISSTWQDKYDQNYLLRFDDTLSNATETNSFTGNSRTFSVASSDDTLYLVEGQARYKLMIVDGVLYLDYGDPVGVVEFILVPGEGS